MGDDHHIDDDSLPDPIPLSSPGKMTIGSEFPDILSSSGNIVWVDEIIIWDEQLDETQIRHLAVTYLSGEL